MEQELLTVAAVARRVGVAPATLRTWDRRYGLGPSSHEAGQHRRQRGGIIARTVQIADAEVIGLGFLAARESEGGELRGTLRDELYEGDFRARDREPLKGH